MAIPAPKMTQDEVEPIEVTSAVEDTGTWAKKVKITVPSTEIEKAWSVVAGDVAARLRLPGFRAGKVPRAVAEKRFAKDIAQQVKGDVVARAFRSAIEKEGLDVVGEPSIAPETIELERGSDLTFDVEVEVKPTFELPEYKGLQVEQEEVEVFEEEVDEQISHLAQRFAEQVDAPEGAELIDKDVAVGPVTFSVDGEAVHTEDDGHLLIMDGHTLGAYSHLGQKWLLGGKVGDTRETEAELNGSFPVEAQRGKKAKIVIEIKNIRRAQIPELNDDMAKKVGQESLEKLKEAIRDEMREQLAKDAKTKTHDALVDKIIEKAPFELPERLKVTYSQRLMMSGQQMLLQMGMNPADLRSQAGDLQKRSMENAERQLRRYFILDALCEKVGIKVEDEEVDDEILNQARQRGMRANELYERLEMDGGIEQLKTDLKAKKAVALLEEEAEIKVVPRKKPEPEPEGKGCTEDHEHGPECGHDHDHEPKAEAKEEAPAGDSGEPPAEGEKSSG